MDKVLQVNVEPGGVFSLIKEVTKILNGKIIFDFYVPSPKEDNSLYDVLESYNSKVFNYNYRGNKLLKQILLPKYFYNFLKSNKYDVIHIHSDSAWKMLLYVYPAKKLKVKKIIVHSHSSSVNGNFGKIKLFLHNLCKNKLAKYADVCCSCSKEASQWMYPKKLLSKVVMIHNGVDVNKFSFNEKDRSEIRKKININETTLLLGTVGNMSYQKNPEYIISICEKIENINYKFIFIGDSKYKKGIEKLVRERNLEDNILFIGSSSEVYKYLSAMDIFLLPSRFEGLPVCGVEAQTNGLPVIYSNKITEDIDYSGNPYLPINEGNEIEWIKKIKEISLNNYDRKRGVTNTINSGFDIRNTAEEFYNLYR